MIHDYVIVAHENNFIVAQDLQSAIGQICLNLQSRKAPP